jgi:pyroglutamyl-peptidase
MKKLLITGFEPFGGDCDNASWEAVSRLPDTIAEISLCKRQVPVEYDRIGEVLRNLIDDIQPDWVICVGQAANRSAVTPEKVAINWKCGSIADNAGILYKGEVIRPDGPDGYFSTLPVEKMVEAMRNAGVPAQVSFTAGTYVCNTALYELLHDLRQAHPQVLGCFIHVPYLCHQVLDRPQCPSLPIDSIVTALTAAVTCLNTETEA